MKNKMMIRKSIVSFIAYSMVLSIFCGCTNQTAKIDDSDNKVSVVVSHWPNKETDSEQYTLYESYLRTMQERYPNITIIPDEGGYGINEFMVLASTNQLPNVYHKPFTEPKQIIDAGYAKDITDYITKIGYDKVINSDVLNVVGKEGRYYGLPYSGYMTCMLYNVSLFKEAGLLNPDGSLMYPKTYEEMAETAKIIKEKTGKPGYGIQTMNTFGGWILMNIAWSYGVKFMEKNKEGKWIATFNTTEAVAALQYIKDLKWKYDVLPSNVLQDTNELKKMYGTGQVGMWIAAESDPKTIIQNYKMNRNDMAAGPVMEGPAGAVAQMGGGVWMFSPETTDEQVDAAFKWFEVLGYTPKVSDELVSNLEKSILSDLKKEYPIVTPAFRIWTNEERIETENKLYEKYMNVDSKLWIERCPKNITLKQEEPVCAQNLYTLLSTAMQEVLTNKDSDPSEIIKRAADVFQKDYLDKIE